MTNELTQGEGTIRVSQVKHNVVDAESMAQNIRDVFSTTSQVLANTMGPEGSTTLIEELDRLTSTKDGWRVLKNIRFSRAIDNKILNMLVEIAQRVVFRVGDGTTSSIVAANMIYEELESALSNKDEPLAMSNYRPKVQVDLLNHVTARLIHEISKRAIKLDMNNLKDEIRRIALISTNGDEGYAEMVADIYDKTNNTMIELRRTGENATRYEIINGYQLDAHFLDPFFINNKERQAAEYTDPDILIFDHRIDKNVHGVNFLTEVMNYYITEKKDTQLVILSMYMDEDMIDQLRSKMKEHRASQIPYNITFGILQMSNRTTQSQMLYDFAAFTGARVVNRSDLDDLTKYNTETYKRTPMTDEEIKLFMEDYIGTVNNLSMTNKRTTIIGFPKMNQSMHEDNVQNAEINYQEEVELVNRTGIMTMHLNDYKIRRSKLAGKMGVIHVGGPTQLDMDAVYDSIEDAVRASESAYNYGYNVGGSLIVPIIIEEILNSEDRDESWAKEELEVLSIFDKAFRRVFGVVINNKLKHYSEQHKDVVALVNNSVAQKCPININTMQYDREVINPVETDIEILRAATSIIATMHNSNQLIQATFLRDV